ncbi:uncharacterized protein LOC134709724 [Mytilus trossulus]|uniref:uncharacterized protein LOC134709724 n=1 Tax=Mytilus trossulus TaxID=6551 RepID=UPI003006B5A0
MLRMEGVVGWMNESLQFKDNQHVQFANDARDTYQIKGLRENGSANYSGMDKSRPELSYQSCHVEFKGVHEKKANLQPDEGSQKIVSVNSWSDDWLESKKKGMYDNQSDKDSAGPCKILSASENIKMEDVDNKDVCGNECSSDKRTSQESNICTRVPSSKTLKYPVVYIKGQGWFGMNDVVQEKVLIKFPDDTTTINTAKYSSSMIDKSRKQPSTSGNCLPISLFRCACLYFWQV